ncbi:MAG: GtrA family protein [Pseudomonadota bacterium]
MERKRRSQRAIQFGGFLLAGGLGFVVDAGVLALGLAIGLPAWAARIPSFLLAVVTTWLLNRRITFRSDTRPTLREFGRYLAAMSLGLGVNYAAYITFVALGLHPLLALAVASCAGIVVNYLGARKVLDR